MVRNHTYYGEYLDILYSKSIMYYAQTKKTTRTISIIMTLNNSHKINDNEMLICFTNAQNYKIFFPHTLTLCVQISRRTRIANDHKISRKRNFYLITILFVASFFIPQKLIVSYSNL